MDRVIAAYGMEHGLNFTLFRPFNWIGPGLDALHAPKEGSSRVVTQFLGNIVRGEPIHLVDGGAQRRCFTYVDDGVAALLRIIENRDGVASGRIHNVGNPANGLSIAELAARMVATAAEFPEYSESASRVRLTETRADAYYGTGYQDMQQRVPRIDNTCRDLDWRPTVDIDDALRRIFEAYRSHVADARQLTD